MFKTSIFSSTSIGVEIRNFSDRSPHLERYIHHTDNVPYCQPRGHSENVLISTPMILVISILYILDNFQISNFRCRFGDFQVAKSKLVS